MFSGELVDARSNGQKKRDKERDTPQQIQLFKTPEMVQIGGKTKSTYRDWLDKSAAPPLVLQTVETRTLEEIESDLMREAEKLTTSLFNIELPTPDEETFSDPEIQSFPKEKPIPQQPVVIFDAQQHRCQRGLRARHRAQNTPVRRRF